ncbi:MAG TPA: TRAP transporter small permease [Methylomirabilota bacterium]|nr:TRAP transporter small permease [Methylomirabilota bacterium]
MTALYDRVLAAIDAISSWIVMTAMAILTIVVTVQVFFRYVLNESLDWGWDVPRLCFIVAILLAIPLALARNLHVGVDLVIEYLDLRRRRFIYRFNALLMTALMVVVAYYAIVLGRATWDQHMPGLDVSVGYFYVALFVAAVHSVLHLIRWIQRGEPPPRVETLE